MIYNALLENIRNKKKQVVALIDPDDYTEEKLISTIRHLDQFHLSFILLGGSLVSDYIQRTILIIKKYTSIPVVLFPGSLLQIADNADAIFLLSLISGRNPDLLIGNHVLAAPILKKSGIEVIPTGYILVGNQDGSSVRYISNTQPVPSEKKEIAAATAMAGEMLGHKLIYLEGGSGASEPINDKLISEVKKNINLPLIVGGGIRTKEQTSRVFDAGADIVVVGTAIEDNLNNLDTII